MPYPNEQSIQTLAAQFQAQTLPVEQWTHEAHLTVALWHLWQYPKYEALCLLRAGIITYNVAVGTPNTPTRGYHETLTVFWVETLSVFLKKIDKEKGLLHAVNQLLVSEIAQRDYPFRYYTREKLFSVGARASFVEGDK